jgi:hypothetical protein
MHTGIRQTIRKRSYNMQNMGLIDRLIRAAIALKIGFFILFPVLTGVLAIVAGAIAVLFLITSIIGICPLYIPFKFSTKKKARHVISR